MPIKLEDLTCEKCINGHKDGNRISCRKLGYFMSVDKNFWCSKGEWLVWWYSSETSDLLDIMFIDRKQMMMNIGYYMWPKE